MERRGAWAPAAVVVVVALAVAGTACRGSGADPPPEPTVPTTPSSTSSTTTTVDVSVIPPVIDEPYLNRVLAALDEVEQRATEMIITNRSLVPEAAEILNSIYDDEEFTRVADAWVTAIVEQPAVLDVNPSDTRKTSVDRVIATSPSCVWLAVNRTYPATALEATHTQTEYVALQPLDRSNDPKGSNPTAWMITADGFRRDGQEPSNPCPA